ncbi:MAG: FAD-binding protein [Planctomycetota bacterium]|jgi:glycolate oxidase FAD binding subunit
MIIPETFDELQQAVRSVDRVRVRGGGTKNVLSADATISTEKLSGILEYEPSEYTFTALAGTPLKDVAAAVAENSQFLPFDPPLVEAGATLGGTVACGLSGPGRFRYGGLRDFFIGVRMVTGDGRVVFGGGKVVKNAAGFDIPKLVVGSLGRFGVLGELTFKVFPVPATWTTIRAAFADFQSANAAMIRVAMSQEEVYCLDIEPSGAVSVRIGGLGDAQATRTERVRLLLEGATVDVLTGDEDQQLWNDVREFRWVAEGHSLLRVPLNPGQVESAEKLLSQHAGPRRYSVGGNLAWVAWPDAAPADSLLAACKELGRKPLPLTGTWSNGLPSAEAGGAFETRLLDIFDPQRKGALVPS